ncbi:DUF4810 domain-containing protein [Dechloromonas sp. CZR5]|uniref:DUF4810 domain-containing protein n=1 Tax=Dechloromonas sp. CZR5 TaxID=2608630 RepID=UPI00123C9668|nr:DUF4810 domain-containing protein [Dechloromonas sp. CZR5]
MLQASPKRGLPLLAVLLASVLTGCVNRPQALYHWGNFQDQQYAYFKGDKGPEDGIQNLERVREEARSRGRPLPPGFQAHLGMLYGQTGRTDLFEQHLLAEKQQFPESAVYVDFLLKKKQKQEVSR